MFTRFVVVLGLLISSSAAIRRGVRSTQGDASIRGKIFETGYGTTVSGAIVSFRSPTLEVSLTSHSDGGYSVEQIPAGSYTVTINCSGFVTHRSEVTLVPGRTDLNLAINLGLQPNLRVTLLLEGRVADTAGRPLTGATVVVASPFDKTVMERASTGRDGRYSTAIPRHGQYVVYGSKEGHRAAARVVIADGERTESNLTLPAFRF